jgi:GT2 family glycosyltransferase
MPISVIIPTYKSPDALDLCLKSIIEGQVNENQIIVVVDGFYDINKEVLEKYSNQIDILNLEQNIGLCRGTNLGVYNARYDKILILNDDNVAPKNWDKILEEAYNPNFVISPNQIEPYPSIFKQFKIQDLGRDPRLFDLEVFWEYTSSISSFNMDASGSTLPIFMSKEKYIAIGGWDENYPTNGVTADWDFFLKCRLMGLFLMRIYACHFYHFVSLSSNTQEDKERRQQLEIEGHEYARYKWGDYIKSDPSLNFKYL